MLGHIAEFSARSQNVGNAKVAPKSLPNYLLCARVRIFRFKQRTKSPIQSTPYILVPFSIQAHPDHSKLT